MKIKLLKLEKWGRWGDGKMGEQGKIFPCPPSPCHPTPLSLPQRQRLALLCCCLLLLGSCHPQTNPDKITLQVGRVVSGQTLEVFNPKQQPPVRRVRLIGIEVPDLKQQPWGKAARERLEAMLSETVDTKRVLGKVSLEQDRQPEDNFGRTLAYVWQGDTLLNEELVKEGYALASPKFPNHKYDTRLTRAQEYARIMGYGIWQPDKPLRLTPKEFRLQNP